MNAATNITQSPPTLLVVDDDPALRLATVRSLQQAGYAMLEGSTATEALALTRAHQPALVLLAEDLPDGDGREVARQVKTDPALTGALVVLLSGLKTSPEEQSSGLGEDQADGYILRPASTQVLLGWVEVLLRLRATQEQLRESEAKLKMAQATAQVGSWAWNLKDSQIEWSDEMYRIFGLDRQTITGRLGDAIARVIHPDDLHLVQASNALAFAERKPIEYRIIWPDQSIHHIWAKTGEVMLDAAGQPAFLTCFCQAKTTALFK